MTVQDITKFVIESKDSNKNTDGNLFFRQDKDLQEQHVAGYLVTDKQGICYIDRQELQEDGKATIVAPNTPGARHTWIIQMLVVNSTNKDAVNQVKIIQLPVTAFHKLVNQAKGDPAMDETPINVINNPYLVKIVKTGNKLTTKYEIKINRKPKTMPKYTPIEDINKIFNPTKDEAKIAKFESNSLPFESGADQVITNDLDEQDF